jgi:uncharacterized protein YqkB
MLRQRGALRAPQVGAVHGRNVVEGNHCVAGVPHLRLVAEDVEPELVQVLNS